MSEANEGSPQTSGSACGLCDSTSLTDLGYGHGNGTVICNTCGAHWWKRWYARKEWESWINEPNNSVTGAGGVPSNGVVGKCLVCNRTLSGTIKPFPAEPRICVDCYMKSDACVIEREVRIDNARLDRQEEAR